MNKVILVGRVKARPELRETVNHGPYTRIEVVTEEVYKKDGETKKITSWHKVQIFGRMAEVMSEYLNAGTIVAIEAALNYYTNNHGHKEAVLRARKIDIIAHPKRKSETNHTPDINGMNEDLPF